jgi:hypothetical protein
VELGYDLPVTGRGPQAIYAYYYYSKPEFLRTNIALRLAVAPVYFDGELGFRGVAGPNTDLGAGLSGGGFSDNYYEIRQGQYIREESFDGHGGSGWISLYHRLNPDDTIPLNLIARGGTRYSTFAKGFNTASAFHVPEGRLTAFTRAGVRFGGKEPSLYPDPALEVSIWFERQWRDPGTGYGYQNERITENSATLYWLYMGFAYGWTNSGHKVSFALTAGGADPVDRFSAYRLGGVLPLVAEFPLILPGYYYQEISARRFAHMSAAYGVPIGRNDRWQFRVEAATACVDYLPGFELPGSWQTGAGCGISYTSPDRAWRAVMRYGYGFNAPRDNTTGAHTVGLLLQYDFEPGIRARHREG